MRQGADPVEHPKRYTVVDVLKVALLMTASLWPAARASTTAELDDAAARVQYAFYTDDVRTLQELHGVLANLEVPAQLAAMKEYYLGFVQWKTAQLHRQKALEPAAGVDNRGEAAKAAQACNKHMQTAVERDVRFAEAYAIAALCDGLPQTLRGAGIRPAFNPCGRSKGLQAAMKLEPDNPRVKLVVFLCRMDPTEQQTAAQLQQLRDLVAAFEAEPPSRPGKPDWGEAEALVLLGELYLSYGDSLAARDALERALVIAPDFRAAQKLLQTAAARPR